MHWNKLDNILKTVDGIVLSSPHALRYFTGFCGGEGLALITSNQRYLLVDARYTVAAVQEAIDFEVVEFSAGQRNGSLREFSKQLRSIGYEDDFVTVAEFQGLKNACPNVVWEGVSEHLAKLRMIKSEEEIQYLRVAEQIAVDAFEAVLGQIKIGVRETEIALELEYQMRKRGASGTSFETIVVSGIKSSMPHGKPDQKKLEIGDFVTMDFGCIYHGYCSDMTRTVAMGKVSAEQKRIYETVKAAQECGLDAIRAGMCAKEVDAAAREMIQKAGYGEYFGHSLGHGVGLLIHELPNLSPRSETILRPGMIVTCEPGIYLPDLGGVRIEDMVCVTENGIENLTELTKELLIL